MLNNLFPSPLVSNLSHNESLEDKSPWFSLTQYSAGIQSLINGHSGLIIMMNGNFTPITVPSKEEKKHLREIPPKSAPTGKLGTDACGVS